MTSSPPRTPRPLAFGKYHGAGNDFVCVDDRDGGFRPHETPTAIARLCHRRYGVGADGLILLRTDAETADGLGLRMVYYNNDGAPSSFCGNGARCFLRFAHDLGLLALPSQVPPTGSARPPSVVDFEANDGRHRGEVVDEATYRVSMRIAAGVERLGEADDRVETGSPHFVRWCGVLPQGDITADARAIRYGAAFAKTGINVNYVAEERDGLAIRTYERGVEDETLACGTGVTAAALSFAARRGLAGRHEIPVRAMGGALAVTLTRHRDGSFSEVSLLGPAVRSFRGELDLGSVL